MSKKTQTYDPRFHHEIWSGPTSAFLQRSQSISYVENHNGDFDYGLAALDFKMAAEVLLEVQQRDPQTSNWIAPVCHMVRQSIELSLKELMQATAWHDGSDNPKPLFSHNLNTLWINSREWLTSHNYIIEEDERLDTAEWFIDNLHSIDPTGDLFRFGTSKQKAFGRQKSSDRVGYNLGLLIIEFDTTYEFIDHWSSVIVREIMAKEERWTTDPHFDSNDFSKNKNT